MGRSRCGKHGMKINRLFFMQGIVGQQIDLKKYSKPHWQPMKGTKQWNTASKWMRLCHQVSQLILYTLKPCEVNVSNTIQKWIAVIEIAGHESSCKQFCTIQIKVTTNTLQIPHMVKAWATDCWNRWEEGEVSVKYYTKITSRFSRVSFDTEKLDWKHREVFAPLSRSFPIRRDSVLSGFSCSLLVDIHDWTEAKHDCKPFSAGAKSPDAKETYSWLSSA